MTDNKVFISRNEYLEIAGYLKGVTVFQQGDKVGIPEDEYQIAILQLHEQEKHEFFSYCF